MVLRENNFGSPQIHLVSYPPNMIKLFRHIKQKLSGLKKISDKAKIHPWNKPKLYCKAPVSFTGRTENIPLLNAVNSNRCNKISADEISGFANTTKFPPPVESMV